MITSTEILMQIGIAWQPRLKQREVLKYNFHTYQPTCHPVAENVFPADDIVIVLSHMPGSDAK